MPENMTRCNVFALIPRPPSSPPPRNCSIYFLISEVAAPGNTWNLNRRGLGVAFPAEVMQDWHSLWNWVSITGLFPTLHVGLLDFRQVFLLLRVLLFSSSSSSPVDHIHKLVSQDRPLRTSLLLWPPYTKLPLPGQASQDLATSMALIHKSCAPRTRLSRPRYFHGPHTQSSAAQICQDCPFWLLPTIVPQYGFPVLPPSLASKPCSSIWLRMGGDRLTQKNCEVFDPSFGTLVWRVVHGAFTKAKKRHRFSHIPYREGFLPMETVPAPVVKIR